MTAKLSPPMEQALLLIATNGQLRYWHGYRAFTFPGCRIETFRALRRRGLLVEAERPHWNEIVYRLSPEGKRVAIAIIEQRNEVQP